MSLTRICCDRCGIPLAYCKCPRPDGQGSLAVGGGSAEPLECVTCGGEGQPFCWDDTFPEIGNETYAIHCEDCAARGPVTRTLDEAIAAWNEQQNTEVSEPDADPLKTERRARASLH